MSDPNLNLSIVPYGPQQVPDSTDLKEAPQNWLRPVGSTIRLKSKNRQSRKKTRMKSSLVANHYLQSHMYNHTQNQTLKDVNLVADADVIKNLIKLGQSSEYTSLMIHKVGSTLFLDDFDIKTELLDKQSASHHWFKSILTNILCKGQNYSQVEAEFLSCISRLSGPELRSILSLESKFLYHSLPQILPTIETVRPAECQESDCYLQNNLWRFRNLSFLCGSDIPIFGNKNHPAVTLKLTDKQEINVLTGIDYWLENLMFSVPEVVMCFHSNGIVQNYERIRTEDIPAAAGFDPELVKDTAQSILAFLNSNCTEPGHTYWLFKEKQDDVVKLYDLSSLCEKKPEHSNQSTGNPYTRPVAQLLLKLVANLEHEEQRESLSYQERSENSANISKLLNQALTISHSLPDVRSTALKKLAYRTSRNEVVSANTKNQKKHHHRNHHQKSKTRNNTQVANRINKIHMAGAACELTTDDITKFCNIDQSQSMVDNHENGSNSFAWLATAIDLIATNPDELSGTLIDTVLLAAANTFTMLLATNSLKLNASGCLSMGMFTLRLLLYADTHDQCQARVKQRAWSQLIELVADLQVPLIVDFDRDGALAIIAKSYPTIAIVDKFMTTMREESKEKRLLTYYATSYADVLRLYGECDDNNDERMERKVANVYNEIGKKHIDSLILKSISLSDETEDFEMPPSEMDVTRISSQAASALNTACDKFGKSGDTQNYALCQANLGRLMRVKSRCATNSSANNELSEVEEADLRQSIVHYQKAVDLVTVKAELVDYYEAFVWDLMSVKMQLSSLYQENPPLSRYSRGEIEKKFIELLESAEKQGVMIIKGISNERFYLRLAEVNYRIAAMHHAHIVESELENKQLNHSVRLSHRYYEKAMGYFNYVKWHTQSDEWCMTCLRATVESAALIKNFNPDRSKSKFLDSLRPFVRILPVLNRLQELNSSHSNSITTTVKRVLQQSLLEVNKSKTATMAGKKEILAELLRGGDSISNIQRTVQRINDSI